MEPKFLDELVGERLTLKRTKPTIEMATTMFKVVDQNRDHLKSWFPWVKFTQSVEDSLKYLFDNEEKVKSGEKVEYGLYIRDEYIGNISVFDIDTKVKSAEVGYWLSVEHVKHGYMTEAVRIVEKEFFENRDLNRMQLKCDEENAASSGVAIKCGYQFEGKFRQDALLPHSDSFRNTLMYSKLKSEYFQ